MTRIGTAFSIAAALGCMATLGAQTPQTTPPSSTAMSDKARDISVTGCLAKGADGRFILSNAKLDPASSSTASTAAGTSTTAGTSGTTASPAGTTAGGMNAGASLVLTGDSDLEKHVGHRIQVSGKSAWDGSMDHGRTSTGTAGTAGSTTEARPGAAAGTADQPRLDVKSVKMIAASCS